MERLCEENIKVLIDVRSIPYSKYAPSYNRESFSQHLEEYGVSYLHRGNTLGGLKTDVPLMREKLDSIITYHNKHAIINAAFMYSEGDPEKCHRFWQIGRYLMHHKNNDTPTRLLHHNGLDKRLNRQLGVEDFKNMEDHPIAKRYLGVQDIL